MRYLITETVLLKPHLETAGEIALQALNEGHQVEFAWLGKNLPWSDWNLPFLANVFGCSLKRRKIFFERLIASKGVVINDNYNDEREWPRIINDWANDFNGNLEALMNYSYLGMPLGMGVASSLISYTHNSCYDPKNDIDRTRKCLESALLVYLRAEKVIKNSNPDIVITFNGRFATSKPIVFAAERLKIKLLRHERGCNYSHYELFSDAIHNFDYIQNRIRETWNNTNPIERNLLGHQFFEKRRAGDGIGWYSFTSEQKKGLILNRLTGKRRLVYFSSSDDEYAAVIDAYKPGPWPDQFSAVRDLIDAQKAWPNLELIIRIHPHLKNKSTDERARWIMFKDLGITVIDAKDKIDSYALIDSADLVASYGSTIGIEAAYWRKPSLLLGPCAYRDSGAVIVAKNKADIHRFLNPAFSPNLSDQENCLPYGCYFLSYGRKFKYYFPESLSEGRLLGLRLGWDPWLIYMMRKIGFGKLYRYSKQLINSIKN